MFYDYGQLLWTLNKPLSVVSIRLLLCRAGKFPKVLSLVLISFPTISQKCSKFFLHSEQTFFKWNFSCHKRIGRRKSGKKESWAVNARLTVEKLFSTEKQTRRLATTEIFFAFPFWKRCLLKGWKRFFFKILPPSSFLISPTLKSIIFAPKDYNPSRWRRQFHHLRSFDTHSTASSLLLTILKKFRLSSENPGFFFKATTLCTFWENFLFQLHFTPKLLREAQQCCDTFRRRWAGIDSETK